MPPPAWRAVLLRPAAVPVVVTVVVGFTLAATGLWRPGLLVAGVGLAAGGALRALLPAVRMGSLAVRSRAVDATLLLLAGGLLVGLAITFPT